MANRGETVETVADFIFLGSKITAVGDCSHEVKRRLLLRRKAMTNLDSILKSGDVTLLTKVHLVKNMVSLVKMYGCGEGNGTPLQYSCLENPMDGGAWWAAVYGVAQSQTQVKRLSSSSIGSTYGCERWTTKKAEHQIIDAFELWH